MRAVVVYPGQTRPPELTDVPEPALSTGSARVRVLDVGVCGTDREILAGGHGQSPPGLDRLVLGHESLGQVEDVADGSASGVRPGDYVVATVRRPCSHCEPCHAGMSDFCRTGGFVERGILGLDGFLADRYVEDPAYLVRVPSELRQVGVLLEPLSVVEKALQQTFGAQARLPARPAAALDPWQEGGVAWRPERALVLGAGPIGLLGAILLRLNGVGQVVAVERTKRTSRARILDRAGVVYQPTGGAPVRELLPVGSFDMILEATGSGASVVDALPLLAPNGVVCLTGIFAAGLAAETIPLNDLLREMVYRNQALVTTVNSNRSYFERGVGSMAQIERRWPGLLAEVITRRMPLERFAEAVEPEPDGVKTALEVAR